MSGRNWFCGGVGAGSSIALVAILLALLGAHSACAIPRDFGIVTNQSSITLSGSATASGISASIQPQGTGSLTTSYTGTLKTDLFANGVSFLSGSVLDANSNGNWKPLTDGTDGSATADYGGKATFLFVITVNFAGRNLVAGVTSGILPIDASNHFDLSAATVTFEGGDLAYRSSTGDPVGFASITGQSGSLSGTGTLSSQIQGAQTVATLTVPVDSDFVLQPDDSTTINLHLAGQLVATSTFTTPLWGDYNQNGVVDAADYAVWRKRAGSGASLPNDDTPGVGTDDFTRWRTHFGQSSSGSGASALGGVNVPEASSLILAMIGLAAGGLRRRRGVKSGFSCVCVCL
jgi:hypothetical protein